MGLRDRIVTDREMEEKGVWFKVLDTGVRFLTRRYHGGNVDAMNAMRELADRHTTTDANGKPTVETDSSSYEEGLFEVWANHVFLDWEGVTAYDIDPEQPEEEIPYSPEACVALMKAIPETFAVLSVEAVSRENYLAALRKEKAGNS